MTTREAEMPGWWDEVEFDLDRRLDELEARAIVLDAQIAAFMARNTEEV